MPTLEPIVVNAPKEKKTYTYSENDIVDIVAQAIKQGKIEAGAGFEEVEVKLYFSDFTIQNNKTYIGNNEKKQILNDIIDKILQGKIVNEIITFPIALESLCVIQNHPFSQTNMDGDLIVLQNYGTSLSPIACGIDRHLDETPGTKTMLLVFIGFDPSRLNDFVTYLATNPTEYISLKFRVEK